MERLIRAVSFLCLLLIAALVLIAAGRAAITKWTGEYYVIDYGAACNALGDDSAAIQAAVNAAELVDGTVVFPRGGLCRIATTIEVKDAAAGTSAVSLRGSGSVANTGLLWNGAEGGTALKFIRNKQFSVRNLTVRNNIAENGSSVGILLTGISPGGIGTETLGAVFEQVNMSAFGYCLRIGEVTTAGYGDGVNTAAASDNTFNKITVGGCTVGIQINEGNSLNNFFHHVDTSANTIGFEVSSGSTTITNGATAQNGTDFKITAGSNFYIKGMRAELNDGSIFLDIQGGLNVHVEDNYVTDSQDASTVAIKVTNQPAMLYIVSNHFKSRINFHVAPWHTYMANNIVWGDTTTPFFQIAGGPIVGTFLNNLQHSGTLTTFTRLPDYVEAP